MATAVSMGRLRWATPAGCVALLFLAPSSGPLGAQQPDSEVQMSGGVSTASFTTRQGSIQVHLSSDTAPGDTISGVVLAEPAGTTPQEQQENLGTLSGLIVELEGQRTEVAT